MKITGEAAWTRFLHQEANKESPSRSWCILSPEILFATEARSAVTKLIGAEQRSVIMLDANFKVAEVSADICSVGLFGGRRLIEFVGSAPLSAAHGEALGELAKKAADDVWIIVAAESPRTGKWTAGLEEAFVRVDLPSIPRNQHAGWVRSRAKRCRLQLEDHQLEMIASFTEGDPAAAMQLLEKLSLIADEKMQIGNLQLRSALFESSRDDVFSLREAIAAGDRIRACRALRYLKAVGTAPPLVTWALVEEGRALLTLAGGGRAWVPSRSHQARLQDAAGRIPRPALHAFLAAATRADWSGKGLVPPDAWIRFERLATALATLMKSNRLPWQLLI
ncbi:MAG: DNA polymerase III subunit delta [Betaproteobacteria bacterium]|nr:DNA polymerase III subunit delta [Betaproteobacteria bacterium]